MQSDWAISCHLGFFLKRVTTIFLAQIGWEHLIKWIPSSVSSLVEGDEGSYQPKCCVYNIPHMHGNIPNIFDYSVDLVVNLLRLKNSMTRSSGSWSWWSLDNDFVTWMTRSASEHLFRTCFGYGWGDLSTGWACSRCSSCCCCCSRWQAQSSRTCCQEYLADSRPDLCGLRFRSRSRSFCCWTISTGTGFPSRRRRQRQTARWSWRRRCPCRRRQSWSRRPGEGPSCFRTCSPS